MTPRDFAYWLQGFFEITGKDAELTKDQTEMIRSHLDTVFVHEAQQRSAEVQRALDEAHNPPGQKPSDWLRLERPIVADPLPGNGGGTAPWLPSTPWPMVTC